GRVRRHGADIGCGRGHRHGADRLRALSPATGGLPSTGRSCCEGTWDAIRDSARDFTDGHPHLAPLVDVLLVLLALVITTLPMALATGLLAFQQRTACLPWPASSPQPINLRIDAAGAMFWKGQP